MSAHDLTRSADCKAYGCPQPAATTEGHYAHLCAEHAAIAQERRHPTAEPPAAATEVGCKRPGCPHLATASRGPYAYLCDTHAAEQSQRRSASERARRSGAASPESPSRNGQAPPAGDAGRASTPRPNLGSPRSLADIENDLQEQQQRISAKRQEIAGLEADIHLIEQKVEKTLDEARARIAEMARPFARSTK